MIQVAQILKSNGTDGELLVSFRDFDPDDLKKTEPVFIEFDGLPVPFFIEKITRRGNTKALVRLTDIESFEDAEELCGAAVYAREEDLGDEYTDDGDFSFLVGWTLFDSREEEDVEVGKITDFLDIPANPCIEVSTENGAAIVPLHEDLIVAIDEEESSLTLRIPEGLL